MPNTIVNIVFAKKSFSFTRAQLEMKVKRAAKANAPTVSGLHAIYLPGMNGKPVSPTWAATFILDTPAIVPNKIAIESNGKAAGSAFRGAYNPQQVLAAFAKMSDLGVKVESNSASVTYAAYSKTAAKALTEALRKMTGGNKPEAKARTARKIKPANKPAPVNAGGDNKPE